MNDHIYHHRKWNWKDWLLLFVSLGGMSAIGVAWKLALLPTQLLAADGKQLEEISNLKEWRKVVENYIVNSNTQLTILATKQSGMASDLDFIKRSLMDPRR